MREEIMTWGRRILTDEMLDGAWVLDAGSYDWNGGFRTLIEDRCERYIGIDMQQGPGVDCVMLAESAGVVWPATFDVVITTEMLEHAERWRTALASLITATCEGGYLVLSTCAPGFVLHGYPDDHWRFTPEIIADAIGPWADVLDAGYTGGEPGITVLARRRRIRLDRGEPWIPDTVQAIPAPGQEAA